MALFYPWSVKRLLLILALPGLLLTVPETASAASCFGQGAREVGPGQVELERGQAVIVKGPSTVISGGDNRICSRLGDVVVILGRKGFNNRVSLGAGDDRVEVRTKAVRNIIRTGAGADRILLAAKSSRSEVDSGPDDDRVLIRAKSSRMTVTTGAGTDQLTASVRASVQRFSSGPGDDRITLEPGARAASRTIRAGLGNDKVKVEAPGGTDVWLGEPGNPLQEADNDLYLGGPGNDQVRDWSGSNQLLGRDGFDRIWSLGQARSVIRGGDGTDWLWAASSGSGRDLILGERGNDKMFSDRGSGTGVRGAYMDGGEGDDWYYGGDGPDTIVAFSGIKKIAAGGGADLVIRNGVGTMRVDGGEGSDTLSYSAHTPPGAYGINGMRIDMREGLARNGRGEDTISGMENLIGSPYDDQITASRQTVSLDGGLGNDALISSDSTVEIDGNQGENVCSGGKQSRCNEHSPGPPPAGSVSVETAADGVVVIEGTDRDDELELLRVTGGVEVRSGQRVAVFDGCEDLGGRVFCPTPELSVLAADSGGGDDQFRSSGTFDDWNLLLEGSAGRDQISGSSGREIIWGIERGATGKGEDMLWMVDGAELDAGPGSDTVRIKNPCGGGLVRGGAGRRDGVVFVGAERGVRASFRTLSASYVTGDCQKKVRFDRSWEGLEGTAYDDVLIGHLSIPTSFLGREGIDTFISKGQASDVIMVGDGGRRNKVVADPSDRIIWDWGLAAY